MVYLSQEIGEFGEGKNSRAGRGKGRLNSRAARRGKGGKGGEGGEEGEESEARILYL